MNSTDFWKLMAGLSLFLYGMYHLEDSIKGIEGRSFKLFLQKHTKKKISAILSGTLVTGILQSSSIVNLIVLSFVGAGMLSMRNALGVALGANIGGTFNSWLVAFIGFKIDVGAFTLPFIAISGIAMIAFRSKKNIFLFSKIVMGIGLLFLGLDYMKDSMQLLLEHFNFAPFLNQSRVVFVLIGFIITALVQTSSATVVLALSALFAKVIPIETAVAVVLGAELGTTIKLLIGSIGGIGAKKRVALGNIIFNVFTSSLGFIFLSPILYVLSAWIGLKDPILLLVAFQTFINIMGVIIFYFLLEPYSAFLEKRFTHESQHATIYLPNVSVEIASQAIEMLEKEVGLFLYRVIFLNQEAFQLKPSMELENEYFRHLQQKKMIGTVSYKVHYNLLKQAEGEILSFYSKLAESEQKKLDLLRLNVLMICVRNAMYSAKAMKDIYEDQKNLSNSANDIKYHIHTNIQSELKSFCEQLLVLLNNKDTSLYFDSFSKIHILVQTQYEKRLNAFIKLAGENKMKEMDTSTLFNINQELFSSAKSIILAMQDYLLDKDMAESLNDKTESIRH